MDIEKVKNSKHPYRFRTLLRTKLPWFLIELGFAQKGEDCEKVNAEHYWYNYDNKSSCCYYCKDIKPGNLYGDTERKPTAG